MGRTCLVIGGLLVSGLTGSPDVLGQGSAVGEGLAAPACVADEWRAVVRAHLDRYPLAGPEDLYKLIHQGVFGSEHAIPSLGAAAAFLRDEVETLDAEALPSERLAEAIAPDSAVLRVNLRPFVAAGGDLSGLLEAFVGTSNRVVGDRPAFECVAAATAGALPTQEAAVAWEKFIEERLAEGLPAVHHSEGYDSAYRPAYRVIAKEYLEGLMSRR